MKALTYAVTNQKGGVGKTTTAVNLASCIAEGGYKTLLVDLDPQSNATVGVGVERGTSPTVYDVLAERNSANEAVVETAVGGLSLLPAGGELAGANVELPTVPGFESLLHRRLGETLQRFDFCFLDCPPSLGPLTVMALNSAQQVIVPVQAEYFALEGLADLLNTLTVVRRQQNKDLSIAGILITMYDARTRLANDVAQEIEQHFPNLLFKVKIPRNIRLSEAPSFGKPVIHHDPHCAGAKAYFELAKEVVERGLTRNGSGPLER